MGKNALNGSGTLNLNGGVVQATIVTGNGSPTTSLANFNGGTLLAATDSGDFIDASTTGNIQPGGLILDDGGFFAINTCQLATPDRPNLDGRRPG